MILIQFSFYKRMYLVQLSVTISVETCVQLDIQIYEENSTKISHESPSEFPHLSPQKETRAH